MMARNLAILGVLMASIAAYTWFDGRGTIPSSAGKENSAASQETTQAAQAQRRQQAPDFTFKPLTSKTPNGKTPGGKTRSLSGFKGRPVILNFWASWCAPCVIEFPAMLELAQKTDGVFIFLSQDDADADIERFIKRYGKDLPLENVYIARDENKETAQKLYQTFKLPETYIIDNEGRIAEKIIGADIDWSGPDMQQKINTLSPEQR